MRKTCKHGDLTKFNFCFNTARKSSDCIGEEHCELYEAAQQWEIWYQKVIKINRKPSLVKGSYKIIAFDINTAYEVAKRRYADDIVIGIHKSSDHVKFFDTYRRDKSGEILLKKNNKVTENTRTGV